MIALVYLALLAPLAVKAIAGYKAGKPPAATNTHTLDAYKQDRTR